jgi:hypothetical protein
MIKFNRVVVIRPYFFFHSEGLFFQISHVNPSAFSNYKTNKFFVLLLSDSKDSNTRFLPNLKLKKKVSIEIPIKSVMTDIINIDFW